MIRVLETVGGCGGTHIKYIKNMENELQGNVLGTGFTGNGFEISRNPNVSSLDVFFFKDTIDFQWTLPHYVQRSLAIKSI